MRDKSDDGDGREYDNQVYDCSYNPWPSREDIKMVLGFIKASLFIPRVARGDGNLSVVFFVRGRGHNSGGKEGFKSIRPVSQRMEGKIRGQMARKVREY